MEPLTIILTVLAAGASGLADAAAQDLYNKLNLMVVKKFNGKPDAELALAKYQEKPEIWAEPLKAELIETGVVQDNEILRVAKELMKVVKPQQTSVGKFNVQAEKIEGLAQGDGQRVQMNFGNQKNNK